MSLLSTSFASNILLILVAIITIVFLYLKWKLAYWNGSGLPTLSPVLFFGDGKDTFMGRISLGELARKFYTEFKSKGHKHGGVLMGTQPTYVPVDPEIIKHIMQTDFSHFVNRGGFTNEENDPLTAHLFSLQNEKWRNLRVKLTPTFTSGKMKMMFDTIANCCDNLQEILNKASLNGDSIDTKEVLTRLTTDVIGSCAFGLDCNSLKDPEAEFRQNGKKIFAPTALFRFKVLLIHSIPHSFLKAIGLKLLDSEVEKFFMKVVKDTVAYRENNNIQRKDFMQLLIQLKNHTKIADDEHITPELGKNESKEKGLTMNEIAAQAFVFFLAGFDTSSTTMTFALYEIAANLTIQEKIRQEIETVLDRYNGNLTYDAVMEMSYLENVLQGTHVLRILLQSTFSFLKLCLNNLIHDAKRFICILSS